MKQEEIFVAAAKLYDTVDLKRNGYANRMNGNRVAPEATCVCTTGALMAVANIGYNDPKLEKLAEKFLAANNIPKDYSDQPPLGVVFNWNDQQGRTKKDVQAALCKAAA